MLQPTCLAFDEQVAGTIADDPVYAMLVCLFDLVRLLAGNGKVTSVKNFANDSPDISLERVAILVTVLDLERLSALYQIVKKPFRNASEQELG